MMGGWSRDVVSSVVAACLSACLLADPIDAPKCGPGFHPELQKCVPDEAAQKRIKIVAGVGGAPCNASGVLAPTFDPAELKVRAGEEFQFENTDVVAHEIRGVDGTVWVNVAPSQLSAFASITKVGTWGYRASGCENGGTVKVE